MTFAVLLIHQFEEYRFPGGFPAIMNKASHMPPGAPAIVGNAIERSDTPNRYPLNQNNAMIINVFAAYPFFLVPVFFPEQAWLGLASVVFGFAQLGFHGVLLNRTFHGVYNPGLAAVVLGHFPLGIWYIAEDYSENAIRWWDWPIAIVLTAAFAFLTLLKMTFTWLADPNSPYPWSPEELARWDVDGRMARLHQHA